MILEPLKKSLCSLEIPTGVPVCIFSDLTKFPLPKTLKEEVLKKGLGALCESYLSTFWEVLGAQGTMAMPAFTYSACNGEVFDVENSPSTVGLLPEYFRKQRTTVRSHHPIFSFCAQGTEASALLDSISLDSFGEDSFFGRMRRHQGVYLLFGSDLEGAGTFVYHSLQAMKVPYRSVKDFPGEILFQGKRKKVLSSYFVRDLARNERNHWNWLEPKALEQGVAREERYGGGRILLVDAERFHQFVCAHIEKDPNGMIASTA